MTTPRAILGLSIALTLARGAQANNAFPDEFSVHFPTGFDHRILVGANFGMLVSEDDGATWRYACEPWVTTGSSGALSDIQVDYYEVTASGAVLAQSRELTRSEDAECTWPPSGGAVAQQPVSDLFADPNDANYVLAVVITNSAEAQLIASHDGGQMFDATRLYRTTRLVTGIEIARATPGVTYMTTMALNGSDATLLRSTDRGATWDPQPQNIPLPNNSTQPRIIAIDPDDANKVYLRITGGLTDAIRLVNYADRTRDKDLLSIRGQFSSFLRAGDGGLYAGTIAGTFYARPAGATEFTSREGPHLRCLGQRRGASRIYGCGDMQLDGWSVGYSDDNGQTFHKVMSFPDLLGPLICSTVQTNCAAHWALLQTRWGTTVPPSDGGPGTPDAGVPDAGGGTDAGSGEPPPSNPGRKAGCSTADTALSLIPGLLALLRRRRRPRPR